MHRRNAVMVLVVSAAAGICLGGLLQGSTTERGDSIATGVTLDGYPVGDRSPSEIRSLLRRVERASLLPPQPGQSPPHSFAVAPRSGLRVSLTVQMQRLERAPEGADLRTVYELISPDPIIEDGEVAVGRASSGLDAVGLMINVAWGDEHLARLLQVLEGRARATFFLLGTWAEDNRRLVGEIVAAGHEIAAHGHRDCHPAELSEADLRKDLHRCSTVVESITGCRPGLYTPHYAEITPEILTAARSEGMVTILPTADTADWMHECSDQMLNRVVPYTADGIFVLMHPTKSTPDFLRKYLEHLENRGLQAVGCEELLTRPPQSPESLGAMLQELDADGTGMEVNDTWTQSHENSSTSARSTR